MNNLKAKLEKLKTKNNQLEGQFSNLQSSQVEIQRDLDLEKENKQNKVATASQTDEYAMVKVYQKKLKEQRKDQISQTVNESPQRMQRMQSKCEEIQTDGEFNNKTSQLLRQQAILEQSQIQTNIQNSTEMGTLEKEKISQQQQDDQKQIDQQLVQSKKDNIQNSSQNKYDDTIKQHEIVSPPPLLPQSSYKPSEQIRKLSLQTVQNQITCEIIECLPKYSELQSFREIEEKSIYNNEQDQEQHMENKSPPKIAQQRDIQPQQITNPNKFTIEQLSRISKKDEATDDQFIKLQTPDQVRQQQIDVADNIKTRQIKRNIIKDTKEDDIDKFQDPLQLSDQVQQVCRSQNNQIVKTQVNIDIQNAKHQTQVIAKKKDEDFSSSLLQSIQVYHAQKKKVKNCRETPKPEPEDQKQMELQKDDLKENNKNKFADQEEQNNDKNLHLNQKDQTEDQANVVEQHQVDQQSDKHVAFELQKDEKLNSKKEMLNHSDANTQQNQQNADQNNELTDHKLIEDANPNDFDLDDTEKLQSIRNTVSKLSLSKPNADELKVVTQSQKQLDRDLQSILNKQSQQKTKGADSIQLEQQYQELVNSKLLQTDHNLKVSEAKLYENQSVPYNESLKIQKQKQSIENLAKSDLDSIIQLLNTGKVK